MTLPPLTLVLGGARSGKSRHAEALLMVLPPPWAYLATFMPGGADPEMAARVAEHRARRGTGWQTHEAGTDLPEALRRTDALPALADCLTLWLGGLLMTGRDVSLATEALAASLAARRAPAVLVASEVGLGLVPETPLGRAFRDHAGRLNQRVAALADQVLLLVAGLPVRVK